MQGDIEDYASYLADEAKSDLVAMHQFKILFNRDGNSYHLFFEGEEDSLFYIPEARRHADGKTLHVYDCGGKRNVISVRSDIYQEGYQSDNCLFFVDRDYDDFLGTQVAVDENTYITDNYSIENDISSIDAARIIMEDILRLSRADPEFSRIEANLIANYSLFYEIVRPLTAWILAAKECGCKPNLNNTNGLKGILQFDDDVIKLSDKGFRTFKQKVLSNGTFPDLATILKWRRRLSMNDAKKWVRGKYDFWFFHHALLAALKETNNRRKQAAGKAIRIPSSLKEGALFEILGGRVRVPNSLVEFYERRML